MVERAKAWLLLLVGMLALGCASSTEPEGLMGNTNWLRRCDSDSACGDDLSCRCGVCTRECASTSDCGGLSDAVCDSDSAALTMACGGGAPSLCLPECSSAASCGRGYECVDSRCLPEPEELSSSGPPDDVQLGSQACGPVGVYASVNIAPDGDCLLGTQEGTPTVPIGLYDISTGFNGDSDNCSDPYYLSMLVHSCLSGEGDTLLIHSAQIRLMDSNHNTIRFDLEETELPNPFIVVTNASLATMDGDEPSVGIARIEAIPSAYAAQLSGFVDDKLLAEVQILTTTVSDADVALRPVTYAIDICDGCLTVCLSSIPPDISLDDVYGQGVCQDNASADGRICIDFDCGG